MSAERTSPEEAGVADKTFSSVVFPAPDGPMMPRTLPLVTDPETRCRMVLGDEVPPVSLSNFDGVMTTLHL